jgi:carboxyl-terminal processing protease
MTERELTGFDGENEMKSKTFIVVIAVIMGTVLLVSAFTGGFLTSRVLTAQTASQGLLIPEISDSAGSSNAADSFQADTGSQDEEELFRSFWQAWDVVHEEYVDQPVDDTMLMRGAISGMLEALGDEHTSYLDPDMMKRFEAALNGEEYEGIGAWVDTTSEYLTIISPMPGSPAEKAGLQSGDQIIAIDGEDMTGVDSELVRQQVLGPKGSKVTLTIRREGVEEPFDVVVTRGAILTPTIESKMLEDNIAYVRLYTFGDSTSRDLRKALKTLLAKKPDGLVLDLRNNGGGYLDTAIEVASEFIGDGVIAYEEYGDGARETFVARKGGLATKIPMVVLVNEGSASASEIVAGAIQDRGRGKLVGVTSYGKGSVQSVTRLVDGQGQIRVTIARWLTPKERQINDIGLQPDYVIEMPTDADPNDVDPQLQKAIEILLKK